MDQYSEAEVRKALTPYHSRIRGAIVAGFAEWLAVAECRAMNGFPPILYPRTVTNYVFDAIARNARSILGSDSTVRVLDETQTVKFCFRDVVVGRFKKGDDDHLGQNIPTQAVLDFVDPQQSLPGFPPAAAKVEFVWATDELGTEIESMLVVARDRERLLWSYPIDDAAESGSSGIVVLPRPSRADHDEPLIKPKVASKKDAAGE
ncbi:hypothetical protein [Afifella pfennigii]|uniref:hypothetical protein n=1 Tax=Afifella pfennigii TaxID=209897 RepID=UPI0012EB2856|nr:hypothetical protein [Afifella pfennigii]